MPVLERRYEKTFHTIWDISDAILAAPKASYRDIIPKIRVIVDRARSVEDVSHLVEGLEKDITRTTFRT